MASTPTPETREPCLTRNPNLTSRVHNTDGTVTRVPAYYARANDTADKENITPVNSSTGNCATASIKRTLDDSSDTEASTDSSQAPKKKLCPTAGALPFYRKLIVEGGKQNLRVQIVTVAAWLAGQPLDIALTKAWTKSFENLKANGLDLPIGLEATDLDLAVVCCEAFSCYVCLLTTSCQI